MSSVLQSSGVLAQLSEYLQNPTSTEGAVLYLVLIVGIGVAGRLLWDRYDTDDEPEVDFSDPSTRRRLKPVTLKASSSMISQSPTKR